MAKSKILKDMANGTATLETTLKRALLIAHDLKNEKLEEWIKNELFGYPVEVALPKYRIISGYLKISYVTGYTKISDQPIGISILPENMQKHTNYYCRDGISSINEAINSTNQLMVPLVDLIPFLKKQSSIISILDFYMHIPQAGFIKIIDCISRELIDILLKIDSEYGNLDDLDITPTKEQEQMINNYINVRIDSFTSIGDGNKINDSNLAGGGISLNGKK